MTVIRDAHLKARRLIHLELDGLLGERDAAWLSAHLDTCTGCHRYAAKLRGLDISLRREFHAQREAAPLSAATAHHPPGYALHTMSNRKRAKMNMRMLQSFAGALISLALLVALAGGLSWLFSTQLPQAAPVNNPGQTLTASATLPPTATPTPVLLPDVSDREQITAVLTTLAMRDAGAYHGTFWARRVTQDLTEQGDGAIGGAYIEEWIHIIDGQCRESFVISRDRPQGQTLYNLQVGLADGTFGDLVALRKSGSGGISDGLAALRTDWRCSVQAADTDAWIQAARLKSGAEQLQIKGPNEIKDLRAWYEIADENPVLVVEATFTGEGSIPEVQRETRRFDVKTGAMVQEMIVMEWADGRPFGEFSRSKSTEFLPVLPADTAKVFAESSAELLSYLDPEAHPTATPLPTASTETLDGLTAYTVDAPLVRLPTIVSVLQELYRRHLEWLSQPGWVVHQPKPFDGQKWESTYSALLHIQPDGTCELLTYYVKDEQFLPQEIRLANGDWGMISSVQDGVFTEGKPGENTCSKETFPTSTLLHNSLESYTEMLTGATGNRVQAWTETREGRVVLVLYDDITYTGVQPTTMDPDTHKLEPQARSQTWAFYDLQTGAYAGGSYLGHLVNGKIFGEPSQPGGPLIIETDAFDTLPADLAQVFNQTVTDLQLFIADQR